MKAFQEVATAIIFFGELPQVDAVAVFEYEAQIAEEDAPQRGRVVVVAPLYGDRIRDTKLAKGE